MSSTQRQAVRNYRKRLNERGLARFEVLGRDNDRDLIRELARRLAQGGGEETVLRDTVERALSHGAAKTGGIAAALRRSPLVGADIDLTRSDVDPRTIDL